MYEEKRERQTKGGKEKHTKKNIKMQLLCCERHSFPQLGSTAYSLDGVYINHLALWKIGVRYTLDISSCFPLMDFSSSYQINLEHAETPAWLWTCKKVYIKCPALTFSHLLQFILKGATSLAVYHSPIPEWQYLVLLFIYLFLFHLMQVKYRILNDIVSCYPVISGNIKWFITVATEFMVISNTVLFFSN